MVDFPIPAVAYVAQPTFRTALGGVVMPPGSRVAAYLRSTGVGDQDPPELSNNLVTTLPEALKRCRANKGDFVIVLPGHAENVSSTHLANLVAGTRIVGAHGPGAPMPTFTWNAVGSTWALDDANVHIEGLRLDLGGADGVTKAINVTAADSSIVGCDIVLATSAALEAAIGIEIGTAAHRFQLLNNYIRGENTGTSADCILVAGVANDVKIIGNWCHVALNAVTTGVLRIAAAALRMRIENNVFINKLAASETGIGCGAVAASGTITGNHIGVLAGARATDHIELGSGLFYCHNNKTNDTVNLSSVEAPATDAD